MRGFDCEKADAGEEGPERGKAGADYAEGLLHHGPDYCSRNGVLEVFEVYKVESPDANDGSNASAVWVEGNVSLVHFIRI